MGMLKAFNFVTVNGYFQGPTRDTSWHRHGPEESAYSIEQLESGDTLLFGRVTYELMASYWPTPEAIKRDPVVAERMERAEKLVFSRTLKNVEWINAKLVKGDMEAEVTKLKKMPGRNMALLGSGSVLTQLAERGLIDEYQIMVAPVVLGDGTPMFKGIKKRLNLRLTATRTFGSGVVLLCYQPVVPA